MEDRPITCPILLQDNRENGDSVIEALLLNNLKTIHIHAPSRFRIRELRIPSRCGSHSGTATTNIHKHNHHSEQQLLDLELRSSFRNVAASSWTSHGEAKL
jgi:hypothetical protein